MNNKGFAPMVLLFVAVALILIGTAGYWALKSNAPSRSALNQTCINASSTEPLTILVGSAASIPSAAKDLGPAPCNMQMGTMVLVLKSPNPKMAQEKVDQVQSSHQWLTPEEYANLAGVSQENIQMIVAWLIKNGLTNIQVSNSRLSINFSGTVGGVENTFRALIHKYEFNGSECYAAPTDQQVPSQFASMMAGVMLDGCNRPVPL